MAQVTMSGMEYAELLRKVARLEELLHYLEGLHTYKVDVDAASPYYTGEFCQAQMPGWLRKQLIHAFLASITDLSDKQFAVLVEKGCQYYNPEDRSFKTYGWDNEVDIRKDADIDARWNYLTNNMANTEADNEADET